MFYKSGTWLMVLVVMATIAYSLGGKSSCTYYRNSNRISCRGSGGGSVSCSTKTPEASSDREEKGPAPRGTYLIRQVYTHPTYNLDWYRLYPRSQDGNTYYDYYRNNPDTGRGYIAMHPGSVSWGCITVTDLSCWSRLRGKIDDSTSSSQEVSRTWFRTTTISYRGTLTVV